MGKINDYCNTPIDKNTYEWNNPKGYVNAICQKCGHKVCIKPSEEEFKHKQITTIRCNRSINR